MIERELPATFSLNLARKHAGLALDAASRTRLESLAAEAAQFDRAIDAEHGDEDMAAAVSREPGGG